MTKSKGNLSVDKSCHKKDLEKKMKRTSMHPLYKETNSLPCSKLDTKIMKLKKMLSSRAVPEQYRALKVLGNAMKQSNAIPSGKRRTTMSHLMRADIVSFIYAGFNIDNPVLARPRFECVRQLIASACLMQQNNASATLDFLLRWINQADSVTGKGLRCSLTMLARMVERLAAPTLEFRRLVGASAVSRMLDAIASIVLKPHGQGGWQVQLCACGALAAVLSPHAFGPAPDVALVRAAGDVYGASLGQLSAAVRRKAAVGAGETDDSVGHHAVATMARMGHAVVLLHDAMLKSKTASLRASTGCPTQAIELYRETVLSAAFENFVLVCAPFVAKVMIDEDKLSMYECYLKCAVVLFRCPSLASNHAALAFKLATSGHLQLLALLSGLQADKPARIHALVNSALGALLSALAAETFESDALRERICEGALHLPPRPALWFQYLARPHASDAFTHAVLAFAYFHCLLDNGATSCSSALFPALVAMLNQRFSPDRCVGVGPLLTKLVWFTFAASRPRKDADGPETARAIDALVGLLERAPFAIAFTSHPALLRCTCWPRVPTDLRTQILHQWLLVEGDDDDFEKLELASVLLHPLAAGTMLDVIVRASTAQASRRGLEAMALTVLRWPRGALARTLATNLPSLLDKLLTPHCSLSATDAATLISLATSPFSERRDSALALATASSLSALIARASYVADVPSPLFAAALWLALAGLQRCADALPALAARAEVGTVVESAAVSEDPGLREAAYRLLAHVAAGDEQMVPLWRLSVSGQHALAALGSRIPALALATMQLLYVLLLEAPTSGRTITVNRPPRFLASAASRSAIAAFKFQKCERKACDGAWQLLCRVAQVALREGGGQAEAVAAAPWIELAVRHGRLSRYMLHFVEQWARLPPLQKTPPPTQRQFNPRWETLAAAVERLLAERFARKLRPVAVVTMQAMIDNQPGLDSSQADQLRKRIEELRKDAISGPVTKLPIPSNS